MKHVMLWFLLIFWGNIYAQDASIVTNVELDQALFNAITDKLTYQITDADIDKNAFETHAIQKDMALIWVNFEINENHKAREINLLGVKKSSQLFQKLNQWLTDENWEFLKISPNEKPLQIILPLQFKIK